MKKLALMVFVATVACGGAPKTTTTPATPTHDAVTTTTSPLPSTPPLFTGSFDVESMTDGKDTLVIADMLHKLKAHDGRMTWEVGADKFRIGMWTVSELDKLAATDADTTAFAEFCRTSGEVSAHWEGATLVLGSQIATEGSGGLLRVFKKNEPGSSTRNQVRRVSDCSASFAATRITFEVVAKDESGATRVKATAPGVTLSLVRGAPIASIDPSKLF